MECIDGAGRPRLGRFCEQPFELVKKHAVVRTRGTCRGLQIEGLGKQAEAHGVALPTEELDKGRRGKNRKLELAHAIVLEGNAVGVRHRSRGVEDELAAEVGLLLVPLDKHLVRPGVELPIEVLGGLSWVVQTVLGKLHTESVKRTLMHARDEPLHRLVGKEFKATESLLKFRSGLNGHVSRV